FQPSERFEFCIHGLLRKLAARDFAVVHHSRALVLDVYLVNDAWLCALRREAQTMIAKDRIPPCVRKHFEYLVLVAVQNLEAQPLIFIQWICREAPCAQPLDIATQPLSLQLARCQISHLPAYDFHFPRFPPPSRVFKPRPLGLYPGI